MSKQRLNGRDLMIKFTFGSVIHAEGGGYSFSPLLEKEQELSTTTIIDSGHLDQWLKHCHEGLDKFFESIKTLTVGG